MPVKKTHHAKVSTTGTLHPKLATAMKNASTVPQITEWAHDGETYH
jgi:hypothetical protein